MSENTNGAEEAPEETTTPEALTPEVNETEQPPVDNNHVAEGCEKFSEDPTPEPIHLSKAEAFIKKVEGSPYAIAHEAKAIIEELVAFLKKA